MVCSPEQLAANRRNSKKSCGPKTTEGKAKSRRNGLKHGLTGAGVVILDEDVEVVRERFEAFEADLKPANTVARFLARHAAMLSVRLERSAREEAARVTLDMLAADQAEEDARAEEFERLTGSIADHPAESVRKLKRSDEGIDWLIQSWRKMKAILFDRVSNRWSHETPQILTGREPELTPVSRISVLTQAIVRGRFEWLEPTDWPDLPPPERREAARIEMGAFIDREIAQLEAARAKLDRTAIARARAGAAGRAIFDPSKEATLARKYEAAAERGFYRAIREIEQINASVEASSEPEEKADPEETCDELASSFPGESRSEPGHGWNPEGTRLNGQDFDPSVSDPCSIRGPIPPTGLAWRGRLQ